MFNKKMFISLIYFSIYIGSMNNNTFINRENINSSPSVILPSFSENIGNIDSFSSFDKSSNTFLSSKIEESIIQSSEKSEEINFKKIKVYINPSVQKRNMYALSLGSEAKNMQDIANIMKGILSNYNHIDLIVNDGSKSLSDSCKESNEFNSDIHLALHSNAGGGSGSEIYFIKEKEFSKHVYENYVRLNNFPQRGLKNGKSLYELKTVKAKYASLIELQFHDNEKEARWIVENKEMIAKNLSESINEYSLKLLDKNF